MKLTLIQLGGKIDNKPYIKSWTMGVKTTGLTPKHFEVELIDERIDELPEIFETDLVGITIETYTVQQNILLRKLSRNKSNYGWYPLKFDLEGY